MKVVCTTSDAYRHLMPDFARQFNHHCCQYQEVDVLCFEPPPELPDNFNIVSLGKQSDFKPKDWTTPLIPYFEKLQETNEFFMLFLDDYIITKFNKLEYDSILDCLCLMPVDKIDLTTDRMNFPHYENDAFDFILSAQTARYRSSLQAAIWRTSYFRRFLVPGRSPWEFELLGEKEAMNDGAMIIGTKYGIVQYDNVMLKGKPHVTTPNSK